NTPEEELDTLRASRARPQLRQCGGDTVADFDGLDLCITAGADIVGNGLFDALRVVLIAEVAQEQGGGLDRRGRIGNALACDIWCGAVNRFKHRRVGLGGVDIARGCQADAACNSACQVGQDIDEEVIGDNNVVALRIGDHVNSGGVDVVVVDL